MLSNTTTDRPFLIAGESGTDGELAECTLLEVLDRPPRAPVSANCAATLPPPPDNPWFVRLADWPSSPRIQPRSGGSQSVDGGTSLLEGGDEFAEKLQSNPQLGLEPDDAEPQSEPRVALWMRSGSPTLRAAAIDGKAGQKAPKIEPEKIEAAKEADEWNLPDRRHLPGSERIALHVACPLLVWTLWTNPLFQRCS